MRAACECAARAAQDDRVSGRTVDVACESGAAASPPSHSSRPSSRQLVCGAAAAAPPLRRSSPRHRLRSRSQPLRRPTIAANHIAESGARIDQSMNARRLKERRNERANEIAANSPRAIHPKFRTSCECGVVDSLSALAGDSVSKCAEIYRGGVRMREQ
jgi:hypothetical protein